MYFNCKDWTKNLISGQTISGKILSVLIFILSVGSFGLYINDTKWVKKYKVARCEHWNTSFNQHIDLIFNLIFMIHFFLRLISVNNKLWFLFDIHSLVDFLTIPPFFCSLFLSRNWIGLRFIRALRLITLPNVLQHLNLVSSSTTIRLIQLVTLFSTAVLTTAGCIHLVENSGDPPNFRNAQYITYMDSIYFMVVTFSTVGFGDVTCKTNTGKVLIIIFILVGLALFANYFPEISEIINLRNKYNGYYIKRKSHIVLCGHITYETVSNFLLDFLHKDRVDFHIEIVILDIHKPSVVLETLLKKYLIDVKFFDGSVMNSKDMARVCLKEADCCLVLANKYSEDPDSEDAANILRVISVKNYCSNIKVIIQLIQYHNKAYLLNIPNWRLQSGDDVICLAELKLGFIASNSLAPGFSTLMVNLFTIRSYKNNFNIPKWQNEYLKGASMELYGEYLSNDFIGLTFYEAALMSYNILNLVLIAIQVDIGILIYPNHSDFKITTLGTRGYFITQSSIDAKKAFYFCFACHKNEIHSTIIKPCSCHVAIETRNKIMYHKLDKTHLFQSSDKIKKNLKEYIENYYRSQRSISLPASFTQTTETPINKKHASVSAVQIIKQGENLYYATKETDEEYNKVGAFHWTEDVVIEEVTLSYQIISTNINIFKDHIIVCIFAEMLSPLIELRNFIYPLRSSHISYEKLKPIILLGNVDYIQREWKFLMNFPKLFIYPGSPLKREILRELQIETCSLCVILSSKYSTNLNDHNLVDKEAILSTLNIKAMEFHEKNFSNIDITRKIYGYEIPLITELLIDRNVQFLDKCDQDNPDDEIFMTQSFACGKVFTVSVLDSLMSTAYFNEDALGMVRILLSGCITLEYEQMLTDGIGLSMQTNECLSIERPYHIKLLPLDQCPLSNLTYQENKVYGELFTNALRNLGIICIGIYRRIDIYDSFTDLKHFNYNFSNRYVVTNPSYDMNLFDSDLIYCLSGDFNKFNN